VVQEALFDDRLVIVAGRRHELAKARATSLEQLASYPWVVARPGAPLLRLWRALFEDAGVPVPDAPVTCGSVMLIRGLLAESDFLTLLSPHQIGGQGDLVAIGDPIEKTRRPIGLTTRADWRPPPAQQRFILLLRDLTEANRLRGIE
jgi:DNA-binding transcriptional LysR family regulator